MTQQPIRPVAFVYLMLYGAVIKIYMFNFDGSELELLRTDNINTYRCAQRDVKMLQF